MQLYDLALNSKLFKLTANYSIYCCCDDQVIWRILYGSFFLVKKKRKFNCGCSVAQSCPTLCNPMDCNTPGFSVIHHLPEFAQTHAHLFSDAIQPFHPLSSPSLAFSLSQHQGFFQ